MTEKNDRNHRKKMAQLRYKDEIFRLYKNGLPLSEITKKINKRLIHTKLKIQLSKSTIYKVIKNMKRIKNG
jgi:hypothetical protein